MTARTRGRSTKKAAKSLRSPANLRFPCTVFAQGEHTLILFTTDAKKLWSIVEINRRQEDKQAGYQRALSLSRVKKIAKFVDEQGPQSVLPNSVLISFDTGSLNRDKTVLTVPNIPNAGWVIDGQHRLAGVFEAENDLVLPVVAVLDLPLEIQIDLFVTINREQKGVPSSLYYDLLQHLPRKLTEAEIVQERAATLADILRRDPESPFYRRVVVTTAPKKGNISLTNFVRKISPLIKRDGRLTSYGDEERAGILRNYFKALEEVFSSEATRPDPVFYRTIGFGALINALPTFLDRTLVNSQGSFRVADAINVFQMIRSFDFAAWRELGTGSAAENQAGADLIQTINDEYEASGGKTLTLE